MNDTDPKADFNAVRQNELEEIQKSRQKRLDPGAKCSGDDLVGLAFSGGGIRSATFNLGIVQALARHDLLRHIDYLSTVSGGGYVGSWLTAWIKRAGIDTVTNELRQPTDHIESETIRNLRRYSNYLTPRTGMFGTDTWTAISTYSRNLLLNLLIVIPATIAVLLAPRLSMWVFLATPDESGWMFLAAGIAALLVAGAVSGLNLAIIADDQRLRQSNDSRWAQPWVIQWMVLIPSMLAAYCGTYWLWNAKDEQYSFLQELLGIHIDYLAWAAGTALVHGIIWTLAASIGAWRSYRRGDQRIGWARFTVIPAGLVSGGIGGIALWLAAQQIWAWHETPGDAGPGAWAALAFGPPLLATVFTLTLVLHIGMVGKGFSEYQREWWSRLGGWMLIYTGSWLLIFVLTLWSPWLVATASLALSGSVTVAWIASTVGGLLAGRSRYTGKDGNPLLEHVVAMAPYIFVVGLLVLLSFALEMGLAWTQNWGPHGEGVSTAQQISGLTAAIKDYHWSVCWSVLTGGLDTGLCLGALGFAFVLSWRVDINNFSMHHLYRNRLVRAYLGASSVQRRPHPFTGFDADDDFPMTWMTTKEGYVGPYHLVNVALNLVRGEELAWQQRKAASFVLSPLWSGWGRTGYRPSREYGDGSVSLGTAVAISGAAASPNMGYHSSPALAFLMTIFDVRLGWWLGNPRREGWRKSGPGWGLMYLVAELFGYTNDKAKYVYVSDGGHFENLGIYELVRRQCRVIIACDASQDGSAVSSDLGSAIRKCRSDLGADIDLNVSELSPDSGTRYSAAAYSIGTIRYADGTTGVLIYIKPTLTSGIPTDIVNYAKEEKEFPHQSTGDQWFNESQFESYRALGNYTGEAIFSTDIAAALRQPSVAGDLVDALAAKAATTGRH